MCRMTTMPSMDPKARTQRMQVRADKAAQAAAQARERCEEKKRQTQHLTLEIDALQSCTDQEASNSPIEVAKRVDKRQLNGCSSPCERFAHQLDLAHGSQQVLDKLEKRINSLQKHCGHCGQSLASCNCNCIHCWDVRAQKKQDVADTLRRAAEVAQKQMSDYPGNRSSSVGAVSMRSSAKHLRSLQEAAKLNVYEDSKCVSAEARPLSGCMTKRRMSSTQPCSPQVVAKAKLPLLTRPRSSSCVSARRRFKSNEDF